METTDYKSIILSIVRSHPRRRTTIQELRNDLLRTACIDLNSAAQIHEFQTVIEYLESYSDVLRLTINGPRTVIEAIQEDHISEMNKRSKNTYRSYIPRQMDHDEIEELFTNRQFHQNGSDVDSAHGSDIRAVLCSSENNKQIERNDEFTTSQNGPGVKLPLCPAAKNLDWTDSSSDDDEDDFTDLDKDDKFSSNFRAIMNLRKCKRQVPAMNLNQNNAVQIDQITHEDNRKEEKQENELTKRKFKNEEPNDVKELYSNQPTASNKINNDNAINVAHCKAKTPLKSTYNVPLTSDLTFVKSPDKSIPISTAIIFEPAMDIKTIQILDAVNPHRFWFCESSDYADFKMLKKRIDSFYNENVNSFKFSVEEMKPGMLAAVLHRSNWKRAKIIKLINKAQCRVFLMDYGSIVDINFDNIRYLKDDLAEFPALAHRGVLAYVQPNNKYWSNEANQHFCKQTLCKKFKAKFYRVSQENSYYMSLKTINGELLANEIILKAFGKLDKLFLHKDPVNAHELSFDDYENGKYADISTAVALQSADSWVPYVKSPTEKSSLVTNGNLVNGKHSNSQKSVWTPNSKINNNQHNIQSRSLMGSYQNMLTPPAIQPQFAQNFMRPRQLFPPTSCNNPPPFPPPIFMPQPRFTNNHMNIIRNRHMQPGNFRNQAKNSPKKIIADVHLNQTKSSSEDTIIASSAGSSSEKEKIVQVVKWQIELQKYDTMIINTEVKIAILRVEKSNLFYFLNYDELEEMKKFLEEFNESYKKDKYFLTKFEIQLDKDVVVYHDMNFCRGRVVSTEHNNEFDIFLLDYGETITRKVKEIFYLKKEFMHRQAAVYKGRLHNDQGKDLSESEIHEILTALKVKFITAKIMSISEDGVIEIKLMNNMDF